MAHESVAGAERQPPQWAIFVIAVIADLLAAAGFIPAGYEAVLRSVVMYCLYREWGLAFACGFVLPRSLPLAGVCFLKQKWLALKVSAQGQLKAMAAAANDRAAGGSPNMKQAGGEENPLSHRSGGGSRGEVSGYDVSAVSGEEVVELSSWEAESTNSIGIGGNTEARRRRPPR